MKHEIDQPRIYKRQCVGIESDMQQIVRKEEARQRDEDREATGKGKREADDME